MRPGVGTLPLGLICAGHYVIGGPERSGLISWVPVLDGCVLCEGRWRGYGGALCRMMTVYVFPTCPLFPR